MRRAKSGILTNAKEKGSGLGVIQTFCIGLKPNFWKYICLDHGTIFIKRIIISVSGQYMNHRQSEAIHVHGELDIGLKKDAAR